eukprot:2780569-Prymnesium_polylepis.1
MRNVACCPGHGLRSSAPRSCKRSVREGHVDAGPLLRCDGRLPRVAALRATVGGGMHRNSHSPSA